MIPEDDIFEIEFSLDSPTQNRRMRPGSRGRLGGRKNGNQRHAYLEISRARREGPVVEYRALRGPDGVGGGFAECTQAAA
jgi:hypothetical protein